MDDLPEVRFILAWQTYRVGETIRPSGTLRQWLLANGYVEMVDRRQAMELEAPVRPARITRDVLKKIIRH